MAATQVLPLQAVNCSACLVKRGAAKVAVTIACGAGKVVRPNPRPPQSRLHTLEVPRDHAAVYSIEGVLQPGCLPPHLRQDTLSVLLCVTSDAISTLLCQCSCSCQGKMLWNIQAHRLP